MAPLELDDELELDEEVEPPDEDVVPPHAKSARDSNATEKVLPPISAAL
jgi:hypothetical protein